MEKFCHFRHGLLCFFCSFNGGSYTARTCAHMFNFCHCLRFVCCVHPEWQKTFACCCCLSLPLCRDQQEASWRLTKICCLCFGLREALWVGHLKKLIRKLKMHHEEKKTYVNRLITSPRTTKTTKNSVTYSPENTVGVIWVWELWLGE